ncbi:MAG: sigma-E processing peptidase SpoIIGA [Lachnospiraceae bacterium]|nr:sigma-E processing peptidase SpoIIGA [Lachnospiraceae bacterium]
MEIEIYLDSLFFMNLVINLWIMKLVTYRFSLDVKEVRFLGAAGLGAGAYIILFFLPGNGLVLQFMGSVLSIPLMVVIITPKRKRRFFSKMLGMGFFYSFIISGVLRAVFNKWKLFTGQEVTLFSVLLGVYLCTMAGAWLIRKGKQSAKRSIYRVTITSAGVQTRLKALLDTGNSLVEPFSKRPVCLIEEELLARITLENTLFLRAIPFRSVGCEQGILYGVEIPELKITCEEKSFVVKNVICAGVGHKLSEKGVYQMILHPALLEEEYKGDEKEERLCC